MTRDDLIEILYDYDLGLADMDDVLDAVDKYAAGNYATSQEVR
jgi:hypothetical protein